MAPRKLGHCMDMHVKAFVERRRLPVATFHQRATLPSAENAKRNIDCIVVHSLVHAEEALLRDERARAGGRTG